MRRAGLRQACAVPFREGAAGLEFLAVTNRKRKWIFPKGLIDEGEDGPATAAKEALEEAGVRGRIARAPFASYGDRKGRKEIGIDVYLLRVDEVLDSWEEDDERDRRWADPAAMREIIRRRLRPILDAALETIRAGDPERVPA